MSELETLKDLMGKVQSVIKWRLTDVCNYDCEYCLRRIFVKDANLSNSVRLKNDLESCEKVIPEVSRIINELPGKVKLDLIGGEISLFNLHDFFIKLISGCNKDKLTRISMTTNMFRPADYYNDLINLCASYNVDLSVTCSFHDQIVSLSDFMNTFTKIKSNRLSTYIKAEMVSTLNNQDLVKQFIDYCESNNLTYAVERDMFLSPDEKKLVIAKSSSLKSPRYLAEFSDGSTLECLTRNDFITNGDNGNSFGIDTTGKYCSRDYDYVYLEEDKHYGRILSRPELCCKGREPIEDFHVLKQPELCTRGICSLCGHISISNDIERLKK